MLDAHPTILCFWVFRDYFSGIRSVPIFNFNFQIQFQISNFDFQFLLTISISNLKFLISFSISILISIFNVDPLPYDLSMWPRITRNRTLAIINHEPDPYYLPLARSTNNEPDRWCLRLLRSTYHGSHPMVCGFYVWPDFLTTSLKRYSFIYLFSRIL